ncbi:glycosyltransferase [Candidatus Pelagibacter sp.]|uniref:glycosyltransferase n=1 Tax=Candidatus Pelagibacter sp. TaxID=2024849 RepID=UPI003F839AB2
MSRKTKISVVIPTYNRPKYLNKILYKLVKSTIPSEILICDGGSNISSKSQIKQIINKYYSHNIKYFDIGYNNHSAKRNKGIKNSNSKYIVLLDDDCIPEKKFLEKYYSLLEKNKFKKYCFCGSVVYPNNILKKNFIKFRQSRHFVINQKENFLENYLHPRNIVTMNMAFKKKIIIDKKIFFYEKFNIYGFEDYEFGYRLKENDVKFVASYPLVYHYDERSFKQYLEKIKFVGYEGGNYLIKLNKKASLENNYIKIQTNFVVNLLKKTRLSLSIFKYLERNFVILEKKMHLPNIIYKILCVNAYLIGYLMSSDKKNDKFFIGWYK